MKAVQNRERRRKNDMIDETNVIDRVCAVCRANRALLHEDYLAAVRELCSMFGEKYVRTSDGGVLDDYEGALSCALLFCASGDRADREEFLERAGRAFVSVWRRMANEKRRGLNAGIGDRS